LNSVQILVVTSGEATKRSAVAAALVEEYNAEVVPGKAYPESRKDRLLSLIGLGNIVKNIRSVNESILDKMGRFDVLFIIKGNFVKKETLIKIKDNNPDLVVVGWSSDDMYFPHNHSNIFRESAGAYDFFYTSKSINIENKELENIGFRVVKFLHQGFDRGAHQPIRVPDSLFRNKVVFIGCGEEDRFRKMNFLARNGVTVHVWGNGWTKWMKIRAHDNLHIHGYPLIGDKYAEALTNSAINLCFLRKLNRDRHTARTFEIPACGGFMLAERTLEHMEYFSEDCEAAYFSDEYELLEKVEFYLNNDEERQLIAERGYNRSEISGYSYNSLVRGIVEDVMS